MNPKVISLIAFSIWITLFICQEIYFKRNLKRHRIEMPDFVKREIKGILISLEDNEKSTYALEFQLKSGFYEVKSLPIGWLVNHENIQVGDSVSKEANSPRMRFYRLITGKFKEYTIFIYQE